MWKKVQDTHYFLTFTNKLEIYVTDFLTIWFCYFSDKSFLAGLRESNFALDIDEIELIQKGKWILTNPEELKKGSVSTKGTTLIVSMIATFGYPLKLDLKLIEGTKEMFFQKVTQQLLKTVHNLRASQCELRHLLHKKDKEIEEYKCEGGEIALRHLKTIPFNDDAHMSMHNVYDDNFGSSDVPDDLLVKVVCVPDARNDEEHEFKEESMPTAKPKTDVEIKTETVKSEPQNESQVNLVSPRKKQKRKINL